MEAWSEVARSRGNGNLKEVVVEIRGWWAKGRRPEGVDRGHGTVDRGTWGTGKVIKSIDLVDISLRPICPLKKLVIFVRLNDKGRR